MNQTKAMTFWDNTTNIFEHPCSKSSFTVLHNITLILTYSNPEIRPRNSYPKKHRKRVTVDLEVKNIGRLPQWGDSKIYKQTSTWYFTQRFAKKWCQKEIFPNDNGNMFGWHPVIAPEVRWCFRMFFVCMFLGSKYTVYLLRTCLDV